MMQRLNAQNAISLLALAVALTACGGGDTGNTSTGPAPSTQIAAASCATPPQLFTDKVWPSMSSTCMVCHRAGAVASGTGMVFTVGATAEQNYATLRAFANAKADLLMSKSIGLPTHSGGKPFGDANSQQYKDLAALLPVMKQTCNTEVLATGQFWESVKYADNATTLAKAAHLFKGANPTAAEYSAVASGGEATLRQTMRGYMDNGPAFDRFLTEVGHTQFLVNGVVVFGNDRGLDPADWPMAADVINNQNLPAGVRTRFEATIRNEPINLLKYIVKNDRPATDLVAGNYTVMNGVTAPLLGAQVQGSFVNPADDTEFLPAVLPNARLGGNREHAGVLTTQSYLDRFPTTETNRNRHRIAETMKRFAALYIPELASRPLEDGQFRLSIVDNPGCAVCHDVMDPMTAGFQNWAPNNRFRPTGMAGDAHALPATYLAANYPTDSKGNRYFQPGDKWFRDARAPGYGNTMMPSGYDNPTAAQWLGGQIASDSRFALGMVHFMFKGLTGREPLRALAETTGPDAAARQAAYNAQHEEFKAIAATFAAGGYKIKDLLVELMMSKGLRANGISGTVSAERSSALAAVGSANVLSPVLLNQKLTGLVGAGWAPFNNAFAGEGLSYGNFNGIDRRIRQQDISTNQISVSDRLIVVNSCNWTSADFARPVASRFMFPQVALTDTPATQAGSDRIRANIAYMMKQLWQKDVTTTDAEVTRMYEVLAAVYADRANAGARPSNCGTGTNDPVVRMWAAGVGYMISDPAFLTW